MQELDHDLHQSLILAAEDCPSEDFDKIHVFQSHEERIIQALCAHGPVLIRGGRGSGKSALMIEASRRLRATSLPVIGVYLSLRHLPLLRSTGQEYERLFCSLLSEEVQRTLDSRNETVETFDQSSDLAVIQRQLRTLFEKTEKRIVLLFDDVAHIGREASLEEFFGIFRTISSNGVSCKAAIYPGVTRFGVRFDVINDATVLDLSRDERAAGYDEFFWKVTQARFPTLAASLARSRSLEPLRASAFIGRSVVGNMRGFVSACTRLANQGNSGFPALETVLKELASEYYWPLLEEVAPKLGAYKPLVATARELAEALFKVAAAQNRVPSVIVHRDVVQQLSKVFEILEYAGFISKREASRALRSGGRGPRYALNLANLLELTASSRLTKSLFDDWMAPNPDQPTDINLGSDLVQIKQPAPLQDSTLEVLSLPIETLVKSNVHPYGLTRTKLDELKRAGYDTIGKLADATDESLMELSGIGPKWIARIRSVVGQAVWM